MSQIKSFSDLQVKAPTNKGFIGDQISIKKILGKEIIVHEYKICPSKFTGNRLDLQITYDDEKRVAWTSSVYLISTIEQVTKEMMPFKTKIILEEERYKFT